jgi:DnaJ-class molecular chaperone
MSSLQGTTIADLETLVEHCILRSRQPMTLGQIRTMLRVWDVCESCEATGRKNDLRCGSCQGTGYRNLSNETITKGRI